MTLYYVTGYDHHNNEWWRFNLTARSSEAAGKTVREYHNGLTRINVIAVCETENNVFIEL